MNFPISFKPKVAIAKFIGKMQKKVWYYEKWVRRHASFPPRRSVKALKREVGFVDGGATKMWISKEVIYYECTSCHFQSSLLGGFAVAL